MNTRLLAAIIALAVAGLFFVHAEDKPKSAAADPRIDKLIQQNEQILKNQDDIKQKLEKLSQDLMQLRRRSS